MVVYKKDKVKKGTLMYIYEIVCGSTSSLVQHKKKMTKSGVLDLLRSTWNKSKNLSTDVLSIVKCIEDAGFKRVDTQAAINWDFFYELENHVADTRWDQDDGNTEVERDYR